MRPGGISFTTETQNKKLHNHSGTFGILGDAHEVRGLKLENSLKPENNSLINACSTSINQRVVLRLQGVFKPHSACRTKEGP